MRRVSRRWFPPNAAGRVRLLALAIGMATVGLAATSLGPGKRTQRPIGPVVIDHPCSTFVSETAPLKTPRIQGDSRDLELVISFTPAKNDEVDDIVAAVEAGFHGLHAGVPRIALHARRIEGGRLVLSVGTEKQARDVLRVLCFEAGELTVASTAPRPSSWAA